MAEPDIPVEGAVEGGRYRAVSDLPTPTGPTDPTTTDPGPPSTPVGSAPPLAGPGGDGPVGAEIDSLREAATALDGLGDELDRWAAATDGLRLALGPQGRGDATDPADEVDLAWRAARPERPPVPAGDPAAVPSLHERRRRAQAELVLVDPDDAEPRRFAAQESERTLHALAGSWERALTVRAEAVRATARTGLVTADDLDAAGNL